MKFNIFKINSIIKSKIENFNNKLNIQENGEVIYVSDGICHVFGLYNVMQNELLEFPNNIFGLALNLEYDFIGVIILGDYKNISEGDVVKRTKKFLEVPVGFGLCGRIINSLGEPIDGKGKILNYLKSQIERDAPSVIFRESISEPLYTGIKAIDSMIPIGKGQRELIIGDRQTGKTSIAIDTIINQKGKNVICIYNSIGQKASSLKNIVNILNKYNAMEYTIIVSSFSSEPAAMQYISPYTACTIGEFFRDRGHDSLIIYDDLSKHAISYRQISLLLKRPSGREAYPGDIFYLHSKLLERSSRVNSLYVKKFTNNIVKNKTGSLTAIPIIETQLGDLSSFIPTNVISITDGQIFLENSLFNSNIRPAINAGISVSRVGGSAQSSIIKNLSKGIRNNLAQYKEMESFIQFSSDLDFKTKNQLNRGIRIIEIFKQKKYYPINSYILMFILYILNNGYLDDIEVNKLLYFEKKLIIYIKKYYKNSFKKIEKLNYINEKNEKFFKNIILDFKNSFK